jgi:hypothetical protein
MKMETASTSNSNTRTVYGSFVCWKCGDEIYFDDNHISKNGKKVPLSKKDGKPHQCPNRPFYGSRSTNSGLSETFSSPTRIDTTEPILAELLQIVKRIEKCTIKSSPSSDSEYDPQGGGRK